jgi:hypothetical protein
MSWESSNPDADELTFLGRGRNFTIRFDRSEGNIVFNSEKFSQDISAFSDRPILLAAYLFYQGKIIYDSEIRELQRHFQQQYLVGIERETNEFLSKHSFNISFPNEIFTSNKVKTFFPYIRLYYQQRLIQNQNYFVLITGLTEIFQKYERIFKDSSSDIRERYEYATNIIEKVLVEYEEDEVICDAFAVIETIDNEFVEKMTNQDISLDEMKTEYTQICANNGIQEEDFVEALFDISYQMNRSIISLSRCVANVATTLCEISQN